MTTIDMQTMRYINLLDGASQVKTRKCFVYNNVIYFAVPSHLVSRAIGPNASNIRKIQDKLGKKVRVIREAEGVSDADRFVQDIVAPARFKSLEIKENSVIITAGNKQNKASLIGRNRRREDELKKIFHDIFAMEVKIV